MSKDFSYKDLRGYSFKNQNLEGAKFSNADIRGTDFSNAKLRGATFNYAVGGLQRRWAGTLITSSWALSGVSGLFSLWVGAILASIHSLENSINSTVGVASLLILAIFIIITIREGLIAGFAVSSFILAIAFAIAIVFAIAGIFVIAIADPGAIAVAATIGTATAVIISGAGATAFAVAVAIAGAVAGAIATTIAGTIGVVVAEALTIFAVITGTIVGVKAGAIAIIVSGIISTLGLYIGWRSLAGDQKHAWVRPIAFAIAATKGTSFRGADLTDADFTQSTLKSTDFRGATITRTRWYHAKIDYIRPGTTYLQNEQVRHLITTGIGKNRNCDRFDLRGLNLYKADLENSSFIDADLYQANLVGANLSRTILVRANFEKADLRGACLTGSCIQDWIISKGTKLDGIICEYIYLKWTNEDKRDQMPPRGKFKEGGFALFAKYILDTIDIYHNKDINPRLALTVLKSLSRDYDEPLEIVAVGKRGDKLFIKVKLSEGIEQEKFKEEYFSRYDDSLMLVSSSSQLLPPVDELVENKLIEITSDKQDEVSSVNVTYIEYINTPKDLIIEGEITVGTIEAGGNFINQSGSFGIGVNTGEVKTEKLAGTINEASQRSLAETAVEIQQLLRCLEETNPTDTETVIAAKAADEIRNNPTLKARVVGAIKSGGKEAFKEAVNNPLINILIAIIEGWQEAQ